MNQGSSARSLAGTSGRVLWTLTETKSARTITCALRIQSPTGFVLVIALAGQAIARRSYPNRVRAVAHAASLMRRLAGDGWIVSNGIPADVVD
jgi:hypothetical protein